nr:ribonuclease H [Tanacetum cinerariifolium]
MQTEASSALHNDIVSSCSTSNVQETTQLSRSVCMHNLREVKKLFKFLTENLKDFGIMPIFKRTFSQDMDLLEQHLSKDILSQTNCNTTLKNLRTQFENAFNSEFKERMHRYTRYNAQSFKDVMISSMVSIGKYMLEIILHQHRTLKLLKQTKLMQIQEDHSNPIRALNVDSLKVDSVVIQNPCSETEDSNSKTAPSKSVKESSLNSATKDRNTLLNTLESRLNTSEIHYSNTWVISKSPFLKEHVINDSMIEGGIESEVQDDNSRSVNDTDALDADIRPIYDEEPMATIQLNAKCNIFAIGQQHTEQPEIINEGSYTWSNVREARYTCSDLEESKDYTCSSNGQRMEAIGIMWCADHNFYIYSADFFSGEEVPAHKIHSRLDVECKLFDSCTNKVESEPPHGSNIDISKIHECKQTLDLSAGTSINVPKEQNLNASAGILWNVNEENLRTTALNHDSLSPAIQRQTNVPQADRTVQTSNELDLLFSLVFDELLNGSSKVVSKSSAVSVADALNKSTVISSENINQAETYAENDQHADDEFINIFSTPVQDQGETSTRHVDSLNMHHQREGRKGIVELFFVGTEYQLADLFPKALPIERFQYLVRRLEKISLRSDLRWKPTGRIFKSVGLRWHPTGKLFDSCTNKVESEPPHSSNIDISKIYECKQTLDLSAGTSINVPKEQNLNASAGILWNVNEENLRTTALNHDSLSPVIQRQTNVPQADRTVQTSIELDLLFSLVFDELLNGSSKVVSKSFAVSVADAPNQCQQYTTPLNNHTTPVTSCQIPTLATTVISSENINQAETYAENDQHADDEFINIFSTLVQDQGETSTRHVDSLNMHHQREGQKGIVELFFVETEYQLADLFPKALPVERFQYLVRRLGMRCLTLEELEALANEPA